jgi:predicted metal-dependent hydrolase
MELSVRAPRLGFTSVPKHWFADSAAATHVVNGVNLLFPAGERFFVRSTLRYLAQLDAEGRKDLVVRAKGFFGQEGRHAGAHEKFFETMRAQGYEIDRFLAWYDRVAYRLIEKSSPHALSLAVTVALEHFTAILAEDALRDDAAILEHAHPELRRLLAWHAVEELEHKSVAFDVLAAVHPSYALRMAGLALGTACLGGFWIAATKDLLEQDGLTLRDAARELARLRTNPRTKTKGKGAERIGQSIGMRVFLRGILEYVRPGFHPDDKDHRPLIEKTLAGLEQEGVVAASQVA